MRINKRTVLYNTSMLVASSMTLQVLGFLYRIGMSRLAGAEGVGVYQLVMPIYSVIMSVTLSGITLAVSRMSAQQMALHQPNEVRRTVSTAIGLFLGIFSVTAVLFALLSGPISQNILGESRTQTALLFILPCLLLTGFENIFKNCFYGIKVVAAPITSEILEQVVRIIAVMSLLYFLRPANAGAAAACIVAGMVISEVFSSSCLAFFYRHYLPKKKRNTGKALIPRRELMGRIAAIALPVSAAGLINNLISSANTILIPGRLEAAGVAADQAVSSFGVLFGMTAPLLMLPGAFIFPLTTVLVPKLSEGMALQNKGDIKRKTAKAIHVTGLLAAPAMAVLIPLGPVLASVLYKNAQAGRFIAPLAIANLFGFYHVVTGSILNGVGKQKKASASVVLVGLVQLAFTWFLVARPGVELAGFVIGDVFSSILGAVLNLCWVKKSTGITIRWRNWFILPWFSAAGAGFSAKFSFDWAVRRGAGDVLSLVTALSVSVLIYTLLLRVQGVSITAYLKTCIKLEQVKK